MVHLPEKLGVAIISPQIKTGSSGKCVGKVNTWHFCNALKTNCINKFSHMKSLNFSRGKIIKHANLRLLPGLSTGGRPPAIEARWRPPVDKLAWSASIIMVGFRTQKIWAVAEKW